MVTYFFPSDPLNPRRADEHFHDEAAAARDLGHAVVLVDHDALCRADGAAEAVRRLALHGSATNAVYRGWMLRSDQYAAFEAALADRDVTLRTNAHQYQRAHELPGWYEALASVTPTSVWTRGSSPDDFRACCRELGSGPAVLRDYTKSMKHYWHEAAFIPDVADADAAWRIAQRFLELRDDSFVGGFVVRRFETLRGDEVRTWWVDGKCVLQTAHPDSSASAPPPNLDLTAVASLVPGLQLPFVTVDLALRDDGVWRVIELGDGQVSDRPRTTPADSFIRAVTGR